MPGATGGSLGKENLGPLANARPDAGAGRQFGKELTHLQQPATDGHPKTEDPHFSHACTTKILNYLLHAQRHFRLYFPTQPHINEQMRAVLMDWLVDVSQKFNFTAHSIFLTADLIDEFLASYAPARTRLQLVGVACLMIIGKYEEIYPPPLADYVSVCDGAYSAEELLGMESLVLSGVGFELNRPTALAFLDCVQAIAPIGRKPLHYCHYLLESALIDSARLQHTNSELAAGALLLVAKLFKSANGAERLLNVSLPRAKACAKELYLVMQRNEAARLTAVKRKFATERYSEVARFRIEKVNQD